MAGIYIHIPFCSKICYYCDFYKTANLRLVDAFIISLKKEIGFRAGFLNEDISTIYIGGGTPSVLKINYVEEILVEISKYYKVNENAEITIEVNPDDVGLEYYSALVYLGINRLSIGTQSFNDDILKYLNRKHNGQTALYAVENALTAGFKNISCDLIYGIPGQELTSFENDLKILSDLDITHLSSYHLGIEDNTYFGKLKKSGRIVEISEQLSEEFYNLLIKWSALNGYDHYEVSNFAKKSIYSKHNKNYWFDIPYLGLGPSAHSYNGLSRFYNPGNLNNYINSINEGNFIPVVETLSIQDCFNEFILTRLRTKWGLNMSELNLKFSKEYYHHVVRILQKFINSDYIRFENDNISLTQKGFFISDFIIREFFLT